MPKKPQSTSTPGSAAKLVAKTNMWRDNFNPLRGLTIARVASMLEAAQRGEFTEAQWLYQMIERRYPVLRGLIARRRAALLKLDWAVKEVESADPARQAAARAQAEYLRSFYERITNLREGIKQLALAEFRGFTFLQPQCQGTAGVRAAAQMPGQPVELHWLPQWNFIRDGSDGDWYWNPQAWNTSAAGLGEANKVDLESVLLRVESMPVNEIAAIAFTRAGLSQKDWDAFIEIFGLPNCIITMPPLVPSGKEDEYEAAAKQVAEAGSGALPNGAQANFPTAGVRTSAPFKEHLEWQEKDVVLAGTGGKLSMLTAPTGLGSGQGNEQGDAFDEIAQAEAMEISEVFQKQVDARLLAEKFPGQPVLAYWELAAQDSQDLSALAGMLPPLIAAGMKFDADELSGKFGLKLTPAPVVPVAGAAPFPRMENRAPSPEDFKKKTAAALAGILAPMVKRLKAIQAVTDPELKREMLQRLVDSEDAIRAGLKDDPALQAAIGPALAGLFSSALEKTQS